MWTTVYSDRSTAGAAWVSSALVNERRVEVVTAGRGAVGGVGFTTSASGGASLVGDAIAGSLEYALKGSTDYTRRTTRMCNQYQSTVVKNVHG